MTIKLWKVGQAVAVSSQAGDKKNAFKELTQGLLGGLKFSIGMLVIWQMFSIGTQVYRESNVMDRIDIEKQEQERLIQDQLAPWRRIGTVSASPLGHLPGLSVRKDQYAKEQKSIGGLDLIGPVALALEKVGASSWMSSSAAISVSTSKMITGDLVNDSPAFIYRHEEAHAQFEESGIQAMAPSKWSSEVGETITKIINEKESDESSEEKANWRSKWIKNIYREAFADTFALLTVARKGEKEFKKEAMWINAYRLFSEKTTTPSTQLAGSDHAIEVASFIAGQLDPKQIAKLNSKEILELSAKIASDTLAWTLTREASSIGFFSEEGRLWWAENMKVEKQGDLKQESAWQTWKTASEIERPLAVFGSFHYQIGIHSMAAKGLEASEGLWKYDGLGGQMVFVAYAMVPLKKIKMWSSEWMKIWAWLFQKLKKRPIRPLRPYSSKDQMMQ